MTTDLPGAGNPRQAPKWAMQAADEVPIPRPQKLWTVIGADTVEPLEVKYLWYPYIPQGRLTSVEGDPGIGKSWFTCALAAAVSNGSKLPGDPDDFSRLPGKVLMLSSEDGIADTIVPRLIALGANLKNIYFPDVVFSLTEDNIKSLAATMEHMSLSVICIDPVQYYIGSKIDINRANEVRGFMGMLHAAAEKTNCAIVLVRHLNKKSEGSALYRGLGSIDFAAALRSILHVSLSDADTRHVHHIKCNNTKEGDTLTYTLEESQQFQWGPTLPRGFKEANRASVSSRPRKQDLAKELLIELLTPGPRPYTEIVIEAEKRGISEATLRLSRKGLTEAVKTVGNHGEWLWQLIGKVSNDNEKLAGAEGGRGSSDTSLQGNGPSIGRGDGIRQGEGQPLGSGAGPSGSPQIRLGDNPPISQRDAGETNRGDRPGDGNFHSTIEEARARLLLNRRANAAS